MKTEQIIKTLQEHNDWRRGVGKWTDSEKANYFDTISAYELGQTIDAAIERLQTLEDEREKERSYLDKLANGHLFAGAAWDAMHMKKFMDDMSWMRMVGALAVKNAIMEGNE